MNRSAATQPFRFPLFLAVLAVMIIACASDDSQPVNNAPQEYNYAELDRLKGPAWGHFSSKVHVHSTVIPGTVTVTVDGLPPGFVLDSGCYITGDNPGPGNWHIRVNWSGTNQQGLQAQYYQDFELGFYTDLTDQ